MFLPIPGLLSIKLILGLIGGAVGLVSLVFGVYTCTGRLEKKRVMERQDTMVKVSKQDNKRINQAEEIIEELENDELSKEERERLKQEYIKAVQDLGSK